jgi:hypothetical protein
MDAVVFAARNKMKTKSMPDQLNRAEMERNTLRLLCSVLVKPGTRLEICRLIHPNDFLDPLRRAVFEEIQAADVISSKQLRASLPALVARRGFPDFNLDKLLAPKLASEAEIEQLFESTLRLLKLGGAEESTFFSSGANAKN